MFGGGNPPGTGPYGPSVTDAHGIGLPGVMLPPVGV
jgi:hypothetical protein